MNAEEYLESLGWHQESGGLWNNTQEKKHGRETPDLVSPEKQKKLEKAVTGLLESYDLLTRGEITTNEATISQVRGAFVGEIQPARALIAQAQ